MKAISIRQPWASAIALGSKRIETRTWQTHYRGPIAIHASKHCRKKEFNDYAKYIWWNGALSSLVEHPIRDGQHLKSSLPFGCVVAIAELIDCVRVESIPRYSICISKNPTDCMVFAFTEEFLGNFEKGRWGWMLDNIRMLKKPIPHVGCQGLFNVPDEQLNQPPSVRGKGDVR